MIDIQKLTPQWESWFYETDERRLDSEEVTVKLGRSGFALEYRPKPGALWARNKPGRSACARGGSGRRMRGVFGWRTCRADDAAGRENTAWRRWRD